MTTERPILFSAPMVRAILAGQKTQTRRAMKWRGVDAGLNLQFSGLRAVRDRAGLWALESDTRTSRETRCDLTPCPYGQLGDRLWVRETFAHIYTGNGTPDARRSDDVVYRADGHGIDSYAFGPWCPSIHMPRWASRITLEITGVRVERLQAISEADALAEGIVPQRGGGFGLPAGEHYHAIDPRISYWSLWDAINGSGAVETNPWVWVVEFRHIGSNA